MAQDKPNSDTSPGTVLSSTTALWLSIHVILPFVALIIGFLFNSLLLFVVVYSFINTSLILLSSVSKHLGLVLSVGGLIKVSVYITFVYLMFIILSSSEFMASFREFII